MKFQNNLHEILDNFPSSNSLWDGCYKIPWDEPGFSQRMLKEHLSQDHNLASRKKELIDAQVRWIHNRYGCESLKVLDLGCGPGLYVNTLTKLGHECKGIDFSPASIEYAKTHAGKSRKCSFIQCDIRSAEFGFGYDLVIMLFGELNVFPAADCRNIIQKAYDCLTAKGSLLLEIQSYEAVETIGLGEKTWYKSQSGLFSEKPHICLTENHWFKEEHIAAQKFYVIDIETADMQTYRSTTKAWRDDEFYKLLTDAGFENPSTDDDWPVQNKGLKLITVKKGIVV